MWLLSLNARIALLSGLHVLSQAFYVCLRNCQFGCNLRKTTKEPFLSQQLLCIIVFQVKTDLCQTLLPYLIHDILLHDSDESWRNLLSLHIQKFFTACCKIASSSKSTPNSDSGNAMIFLFQLKEGFWLGKSYLLMLNV